MPLQPAAGPIQQVEGRDGTGEPLEEGLAVGDAQAGQQDAELGAAQPGQRRLLHTGEAAFQGLRDRRQPPVDAGPAAGLIERRQTGHPQDADAAPRRRIGFGQHPPQLAAKIGPVEQPGARVAAALVPQRLDVRGLLGKQAAHAVRHVVERPRHAAQLHHRGLVEHAELPRADGLRLFGHVVQGPAHAPQQRRHRQRPEDADRQHQAAELEHAVPQGPVGVALGGLHGHPAGLAPAVTHHGVAGAHVHRQQAQQPVGHPLGLVGLGPLHQHPAGGIGKTDQAVVPTIEQRRHQQLGGRHILALLGHGERQRHRPVPRLGLQLLLEIAARGEQADRKGSDQHHRHRKHHTDP